MANVFGILTAIVLALSIFVAFKNKAAYEERITETAVQKENLRKSEERLKIAQNNYNDTVKAKEGVDAEIAQLTDESAKVRKDTEEIKLSNETKTQKVNTNKTQLDDIRDKTARIGNIEELASKMRELGAQRVQLGQSITDNEAKLANLTAENNQAETQSTALRTKLDTFASGQSLPSLNTRIRSIYPTWGFVTLASGNNAGVVANSTLEVVRDDQTIAKLLVTAVESTTSSASIVPDSIAADVTLMVGDRVVAAAAPAPKSK
jgi:myosin heavy subunit